MCQPVTTSMATSSAQETHAGALDESEPVDMEVPLSYARRCSSPNCITIFFPRVDRSRYSVTVVEFTIDDHLERHLLTRHEEEHVYLQILPRE